MISISEDCFSERFDGWVDDGTYYLVGFCCCSGIGSDFDFGPNCGYSSEDYYLFYYLCYDGFFSFDF